MDIRQIEFFVAVAEELNFTRAAELTHVTQSGLSSSIRSLERELRHQLFDRSPRSVALTPAGHAFLPRARRILADSRAALRELTSQQDATGALSLGAEQCLGDVIDLPDVLAAFRTRHPGVTIQFEQQGSLAVLDRVRHGKLDAGLIAELGSTPPRDREITSFEIARDGFELLLSPEHPLASTAISWPAFEAHPFVDLPDDWTARQIIDAAFRRRRLLRRSAVTAEDVHMLLDLVRRGLGPALVPASYAAKPQAEGLIRRPVPDSDLTWLVHFVARADASPTVQPFADMLIAAETVDEARTALGGNAAREAGRNVEIG
ncbi:LysR family transcriptional regulator [Streptomyces cylindrosporus]|uniref:LysR family transcriptional regulator n=1 Tax=Streptomyces cylindrosporus TaxID=2927583 RepID=A0ABS9Y856_9ACTN|nr:LysR family transcriptional regulator [Streptomyces cylindrosporus]MCI3273414.1 LysR family transcriptional regulator [Streptomyces cylindrosporus]